jgi:2,3-bisphosphoglycerate-dependent phosphoglycerate mutase
MDRTLPLWQNRIKPDLLAGRTVMVVAHANSIRGILKHIDGLSEEQIRSVGIPNGIPLVYKFDKHMTPIANTNANHDGPLRGEFLEKKDVLRALLAKEEQLAQTVPQHYLSKGGAVSGSESDYMVEQGSAQGEVMDARLRGLSLLKSQRMRFAFGGQNNSRGVVLDPDQEDSEGTVINDVRPVSPYIQDVNSALAGAYYRGGERGSSGDSKPATEVSSGGDEHVEKRTFRRNSQLIDGDFIVMIRHGRTEYNKLGIFTGWEDAPLAREGRAEARAAGKLLKLHGIHFDIVYTSWLSRAIETAWLVLDELNCLWLPIVKTWRLNERMYGALTGLSKKMIAQKHGNAQFMKWRRGYDQKPPQVSSFCSNYPGNDDRYRRYATDLRFSLFESVIRTLSHKRLELHRKFPKTESLQDCMRRTIPFFTGTIMPKSVNKGKTVLIASSENAIRGLLMHLCGIPEDRISEVEIPTGLPLVYSFRSKKIRLLEDGTEDPSNPLGNYNFGSAPELLFNSCPEDEDEDEDEDENGVSGNGATRTKTKNVMVDPTTGVAAECFFFPDGRSYAYDPLLRLESAPSQADLAALAASSGRPPINVKVSPPPETASTEPGGNDKLEAGSGI